MTSIDIESFEDEWEDDSHLRHPRRELSVDAKKRIASYDAGRVVAVDRGRVMVLYEGEIWPARYAGSMRGEKVAVGDHVRVKPPRHDNDTARIVERLPRETELTRTADDALDEERVIVANAEQVAVIIAADYLEGGVGFVDRVLVAAAVGGLDPLVCINKIDLGAEAEAGVVEVEERYGAIGYPVLRTSATTEEGLDELGDWLEGAWTVMTGHSGVGKSSLFNLLVPDAEHEVGELGPRGGRHTTVSSRALRVPGHDNTWLVDTPGVRSFGLGSIAPEQLPDYFPELADLDCELDDCLHEGEPGCRVGSAAIHPARLESYRRFLAAIRAGE